MINLKNKNIVITGASRGIGEQLVYSFAECGANVTLLSRNKDKMKKIILRMNKKFKNQSFKSYILDVSDEINVKQIFKEIISNLESIDVLINNAGITSDNVIVRMSTKQWNDVINTNLNGCFYCSRSVSKQMIKQKKGKIINICSIVGQIGNKGQSNYSASKAGVIGLTKSLAKELASRNINVNAINPGYINTDMTQSLSESAKESFLNRIPLNKFGEAKDVSSLACFLASDESNYITGQIINVDGGIAI